MELINRVDIEKILSNLWKTVGDVHNSEHRICYNEALKEVQYKLNALEVKEIDVSSISENLAEAYEYLSYTSTGNLAHNKPMVSARLKKAIKELNNAKLFQLTHDEKYRMKCLGLKIQKEE